MINKVRELMKSKETTDAIVQSLKELHDSISSVKKEVQELKDDISAVKEEMKSLSSVSLKNSLSQQIEALTESRIKLSEEVKQLSIEKSRMTSKVIENVRTDIKKFGAILTTDLGQLNSIKNEMSNIKVLLKSVEAEIVKFKEISRNIKAGDFELTRHAERLRSANDENKRLLYKIDTMERLVARMRRN